MDPALALNWHNILNAVIFSGIGLAIFVIGFVILDLLTPQVHVWNQLCRDKNVALAIFLGAVVIGIAMIISAAVHG
jgi:putative membrane protein